MKGKKVNGDTVVMLVSMILAKRNLAMESANIPYVMEHLPEKMRHDKQVEELVTGLMNGKEVA